MIIKLEIIDCGEKIASSQHELNDPMTFQLDAITTEVLDICGKQGHEVGICHNLLLS